jgi:hypothetical protein
VWQNKASDLQGVENLLNPEEIKITKITLNGWKVRGELAPKLERKMFWRNAKILSATMPLGNHHYITTNTE